jgi:hypothetical protein
MTGDYEPTTNYGRCLLMTTTPNIYDTNRSPDLPHVLPYAPASCSYSSRHLQMAALLVPSMAPTVVGMRLPPASVSSLRPMPTADVLDRQQPTTSINNNRLQLTLTDDYNQLRLLTMRPRPMPTVTADADNR